MSAMVNPNVYKGIEYVQLDELPPDQHIKIKESLNKELFIKILIHGELYQHCILYKDYIYWFKNVFKPTNTIDKSKAPGDSLSLNVKP